MADRLNIMICYVPNTLFLLMAYLTTLCLASSAFATTQQMAWDDSATVRGTVSIQESGDDYITLKPEADSGNGHININYNSSPLDLSPYVFLTVNAENKTEGELDVQINALSNPSQKWSNEMTGRFILQSGESRPLEVFMLRQALDEYSPWKKALGNLYAFPGGHQRHWRYLDTENIKRIQISLSWNNASGDAPIISISKPMGSQFIDLSEETLIELPTPLLDNMGQLQGVAWEGKAKSTDALKKAGKAEYGFYGKHSVAQGLSTYGGLLDGTQLEATGKFRTEKIDGKWWLVDPEGHLFWSVGVTEGGIGSLTSVEGREALFPKLRPPRESDVWKLDRKALSYNFYHSNLKEKYGKRWLDKHHAVTEGRMRAWGINTVGAWSMEPATVFEHKRPTIPYTVIVHTNLNGGFGKLHHMVDPFSEQFEKSLDSVLKRKSKLYAGDPNNIGVFVNNELNWHGGLQLPMEVLGLYNYVPAKRAMLALLEKRYGTIVALNQAWGTDFKQFEAIRNQEGLISNDAFVADMNTYHTLFTEAYFMKSARAVQKHFPGHLFLGSRFNTWSPQATKAASKYCDVISFNLYRNSVASFNAETEVDRPFLISEFHFGSGSHGVWGRGLTPCADAANQAELYRAYVNEAVQHPNFVGAHWFTWSDQPVTGRYDGENFRVGLVSIIDRPYPELTESVQDVSRNMYSRRLR